MAQRICSQLQAGGDLQGALEKEQGVFPPLFISMAVVAEQTGNLPEIFSELERYYLSQQTLRRRFLAQIAWPALCIGIETVSTVAPSALNFSAAAFTS